MKNFYCSSSLLSKMLLISPRLRLGLLYLLGLNSAGCLGLHHDKSEANRTEKCELDIKIKSRPEIILLALIHEQYEVSALVIKWSYFQ